MANRATGMGVALETVTETWTSNEGGFEQTFTESFVGLVARTISEKNDISLTWSFPGGSDSSSNYLIVHAPNPLAATSLRRGGKFVRTTSRETALSDFDTYAWARIQMYT